MEDLEFTRASILRKVYQWRRQVVENFKRVYERLVETNDADVAVWQVQGIPDLTASIAHTRQPQ